jgi:CDGSH-type Zn-finger protein
MILSASSAAIIPSPSQPAPTPVPLVIKVRENGPFAIDVTTGDFELVDHNGVPIPIPPLKPGKTTVTLCRCGASVKKPFCDGTHSRIGFKGAEAYAQAFDQQQTTTDPSKQSG